MTKMFVELDSCHTHEDIDAALVAAGLNNEADKINYMKEHMGVIGEISMGKLTRKEEYGVIREAFIDGFWRLAKAED